MRIKFIAKQCRFQGVPGYQFEQHDEKKGLIGSQFIDKNEFDNYLTEADINRNDVSFE